LTHREKPVTNFALSYQSVWFVGYPTLMDPATWFLRAQILRFHISAWQLGVAAQVEFESKF
jgi:hypothetical protein